ncbi:MAG: metallophosphoesterase [Lachnospiraceae bacterium]|nr:metallophosphoesterase [Lachnospiraceae bacterium]
MSNLIFAVLLAILLICYWILLYDTNRFVITIVPLSDPRIRRSCRAVVVSDLHDKRFGRSNEKLLEEIRAEEPDLILVAGDILTAHPHEKLITAETFLTELVKIAPVCYGNGNHEHRIKLYPETYGDLAGDYAKVLAKAGIEPLVNASEYLEEYGIRVWGSEIDKHYYKRLTVPKMDPSYLPGLLGEPDPSAYNILLAHNPDYFPEYAAWKADLVLSGHVHGGILRVPFYEKNPEFRGPKKNGPCWRLKGMLSPNVRFFPRYDGGRFEKDGTVMLVSRGLGTHTIPFRFLNPGELIVLELTPESDLQKAGDLGMMSKAKKTASE